MSGSEWFNSGQKQRDAGFMFTYSGSGYNLEAPGLVSLADIAHALGMQCRFNGHLTHFYSVAQHSVNVARILRERGASLETQLYGLLHDAGEAYVGDVTVPVQRVLGGVQRHKDLEHRVMDRVVEMAGIDEDLVDFTAVHKADKDCGRLEIRDLISDDHGMISYDDLPDFEIRPSSCMSPGDATDLFLYRYRRIQEARKCAT